MTLLVEPEQATVAELTAALGRQAVTRASLEGARDELSSRLDEDVVVLGPNIDLGGAFRLASDYRVTRPTLSVVLVRRRIETSVLSEAMRNGVREVVEERDLRALNDAVGRARTLASELRLLNEGGEAGQLAQGKVLTVFSAKGGCGKTTLSTNIAAMMAAEGDKKVCLVDLDLAFGDVGIALQLVPAHTVADAIAMGPTLDADGLRGLLTEHPTGLNVLAAPVGPDAKDAIKPDLVTRMIDLLTRDFDLVIVDTPPAFDDTTLAAFDRTDLLLVLTTLDVPAIKNLKLALETLDMINFAPEKVKVVVNRADAKVGLGVGDIEKAIRLPIAARIPSSRDVPASTNRGVAISVDNPRHPVSLAIRQLMTENMPEMANHLADADGRRRPLFRPRGEA
jgi:pilus assembly protein CpaE